LKAQHGLPPEVLSCFDPSASGRCLCGQSPGHREVVFADGSDERDGSRHPGQPPHAHYCVPILNSRRYGVISVFVDEPHPRRPEEEEFLSSVGQILAGSIERRRAEEALRASEQQYRAVYDQAAVGIAEVDLTGRFLRANDRYCEIVGYTREEL